MKLSRSTAFVASGILLVAGANDALAQHRRLATSHRSSGRHQSSHSSFGHRASSSRHQSSRSSFGHRPSSSRHQSSHSSFGRRASSGHHQSSRPSFSIRGSSRHHGSVDRDSGFRHRADLIRAPIDSSRFNRTRLRNDHHGRTGSFGVFGRRGHDSRFSRHDSGHSTGHHGRRHVSPRHHDRRDSHGVNFGVWLGGVLQLGHHDDRQYYRGSYDRYADIHHDYRPSYSSCGTSPRIGFRASGLRHIYYNHRSNYVRHR